eukprot:PhF_6_TR11557/c0_g1_i6/m.18614/K12190/VPS36, EAP45; ESCRT-II complex subunit VPS36
MSEILIEWDVIRMSASQQPQLHSDERILMKMEPPMGLYENDQQIKQWQSAAIYLTSHRVVVVDVDAQSAIGLPLLKIINTSLKPGFGQWSHPKIRLHVNGGGKYYMLSFRNGGLEAFHSKLTLAITEAKQGLTTNTFHTRKAGVDGIVTAVTTKQVNNLAIVDNAFADLKMLQVYIQEVLDVVKHVQTTMTSEESLTAASELQDVGIAGTSNMSNPSTIAAELSQWISTALPKWNNILPIHDIFAL